MSIGFHLDDIEQSKIDYENWLFDSPPIGWIHSLEDDEYDDSPIGGLHGEFRENKEEK